MNRRSIANCAALALLVAAAAWGAPFVESNGGIVMEVESIPARTGYALKTDKAGFYGRGYYEATSQYMEASNSASVLSYPIKVTGGKYQVRIHNYVVDGYDSHGANDCWMGFSVGNSASWLHPEYGKGSLNLCKTTSGAGELNKWGWGANNICNNNTPWWIELPAGEHTLYLAPRSKGFSVDRIALYRGSFDLKGPESPRDGTSEPDPSAPATKIVGSVPSQIAVGSQYPLEGEGANLVWYYEANSDAKGEILIGYGAKVQFTVPSGINPPRTLQIILKGDNGTATSDHQIVDQATRVVRAPARRMVAGSLPRQTYAPDGSRLDGRVSARRGVVIVVTNGVSVQRVAVER